MLSFFYYSFWVAILFICFFIFSCFFVANFQILLFFFLSNLFIPKILYLLLNHNKRQDIFYLKNSSLLLSSNIFSVFLHFSLFFYSSLSGINSRFNSLSLCLKSIHFDYSKSIYNIHAFIPIFLIFLLSLSTFYSIKRQSRTALIILKLKCLLDFDLFSWFDMITTHWLMRL